MITLDLDLAYLSSRYHISSKAMQQYQNLSIVDIMRKEAEKGNAAAAQFLVQILSNPEELERVLRLVDPKNRYLILMNMNENDLMMIMSYLKPEELILGLSIFNQEMIVDLMKNLDPKALTAVVLNTMDINKFLRSIPEEYLDEFFTSDKIERSMIMKAMEKIDDDQLQKMMENYTGQPCYDDRESIMEKMNKLSDDNFMRAVFSFEPKGKQQVISNMIKEKPELFEEFSAEALTYPFRTMQKEDILKSLTCLETKDMLPMVEELPQDIMALIATQIDSKVFAKILCSDFASVIAKCGINFS